MARMKQWTLGKDAEDVRLVFNAATVKVAEWLDSIMSHNEPEGTHPPDQVSGLPGCAGKTAQGMALVFNSHESKGVDILLSHEVAGLWDQADEQATSAQPPVSQLYDLDGVSLMDVLAC